MEQDIYTIADLFYENGFISEQYRMAFDARCGEKSILSKIYQQ
jgi:hypothetical protein